MVHGDDFVAVGKKGALDQLQSFLESIYESKVQRLGWGKGKSREARVLGRIITLTPEGATLGADPALLEEVLHLLNLSGATPVITPAVKSEYLKETDSEEVKRRRLEGDTARNNFENYPPALLSQSDEQSEEVEIQIPGDPVEEELLSEDEAKVYVSVGALLNYIAPDRPEMQYAVKEVIRKSSAPSKGDLKRLKRIGRFIAGEPRRVLLF